MLERRPGLVVDERPSDDEVPGHAVGVARVQAAQRTADGGVEFAGVGPVRQLWPRRARRPVVPNSRSRAAAALPGIRWAPVSPVAALAVPGRATVLPLRPITRGPSVLPTRTPTRGPPVLPLRSVARRPAAPPLGTLTTALRPVPGRTAVLPLGSVRGGRTVLAGLAATRGPLARRPPLLPLRPINRGTAVLPLRPVTASLGALTGRAAVLPLRPVAGGTASLGGIPLATVWRSTGVRVGAPPDTGRPLGSLTAAVPRSVATRGATTI